MKSRCSTTGWLFSSIPNYKWPRSSAPKQVKSASESSWGPNDHNRSRHWRFPALPNNLRLWIFGFEFGFWAAPHFASTAWMCSVCFGTCPSTLSMSKIASHRIKIQPTYRGDRRFGGRTPPAKWVRLRTMIGGGAQVDHVSSGSAWKFNFGFRSCLTGRYWRQIRCRTDRRSWRSVVRRKSMPPAASCNPRRLGKHFCEGA